MKSYIGQHKKEIVLTTLCAVVVVTTNLIAPFLIRTTIDHLNAGTLTAQILYRVIAGLVIISAASFWFSRQLRRYPQKLSHQIEYDVRRDLFEHLIRLDIHFFQGERTGDLMTKLSSDLSMVRNAIGQGFLQGTRMVAAILFSSIVMAWIAPKLALMVFALYLPVSFLFFLLFSMIRARQKNLQEQVSELSNFAQESFAGIRCIKGFALEQRRNKTFKEESRTLAVRHIQLQSIRQFLWPMMAFWISLGTLMMLYFGGKQVITGEISVGVVVQFMSYLLYLQWPLLSLSWMLGLIQRGRVSWQRIADLFDRVPGIADDEETDHQIQALSGSIEWRNLSLSINKRPLLQQINLRVENGMTLGITGPTGSGKTLLTSMVARLFDATEGEVLIDNHPIRTIPLELLRKQIGFAEQESVLFSRTLAHNIGFGVEHPDESLIRQAAEVAHLHAEAEGFEEGYQTVLGERGITLSGGQRQRVAIGRAIARDPKILILDDVLSAVDTQTESAIMQKLQPVMKDRTCLFVSHRISTLRYCDEIIVVENGRITQRGTHDELTEQPGYYTELNRLQRIEQRMEGDE